MNKYLILFALILIQGCSSSGSDSTFVPQVADEDATGVWEGTFTENGVGTFSLTGIVEGKQLRFISTEAGAMYVGTAAVSGTSFTSTVTGYEIEGTVFTTANLTGIVATKSSINGTFTSSNGSTGSFSLAYDTVTEKGSSLAITDGNWTQTVNTTVTTTISIDSEGKVTGSNGGCVYLGSVSIIDPTVNIYGLSLSASSCGVYDGAYTGYIVISDNVSTNDTLTFVVNNPNYVLIGELTRT